MKQPPPKRNGWWLLSWPAFQQQFNALTDDVEKLRAQDPYEYQSHPKAKLLSTILELITRDIPADPGHADFRQGSTLGDDHTSWFRAKFHRRYRLFFRFDSKSRIIIYAWMNAEGGLRKSGDKNDPYVVFRRMLERGKPPTSFAALMKEARAVRLRAEGE